MENKLNLVISIINSGYSEQLMDEVKKVGARGGTIFNSVGSAGVDAEKLYGITINPDKEVIMIIIPSNLCTKVLHTIYEQVGPNSPAQGIAFSLPVDNATSNIVYQYSDKKKQ